MLLLACVCDPLTDSFGRGKLQHFFLLISVYSRHRTFSSSVYVPGVFEVVKEFDVSLTVALLGISMYVVGLGLGYVRVLNPFHRVFVTNLSYDADQCSAHHYQRLAICRRLDQHILFSEAIETNFQYLSGIGVRPKNGLFRQPAIFPVIHHGCRISTQHPNTHYLQNVVGNLWRTGTRRIRRVVCRCVGVEELRVSGFSSSYRNVYGPRVR